MVKKSQGFRHYCQSKLWNKLGKKYKLINDKKIVIGKIEIFRDWLPWFDINKLINSANIIKGLIFIKLKYVVKWKKAMNREKDKKILN